MGSCENIIQRSLQNSSLDFPRKFCKDRFSKCKSLYRKDLSGHFGCVNAIEFSKDGSWLVSGGDDKRVVLWDFAKATRQDQIEPILMRTEHHSNIFCTVFDNHTQHIFSAGNDDRVIRHDINRQEAAGYFPHEEPVYCISLPSEDDNLFATAGEGGAVLIWDVRIPEENKLCLAVSSSSFHGVSFNPYESRLVATANADDGVTLFDLRYPEKPMINYGSLGKRKSAMYAKFNQLGTQILALMRHTGPALYNIHEKKAVVEFSHTNYSNVCTMKSPCFMGDDDQYVCAGSDDFNIYIWENPGNNWQDAVVKDPFMILEGHRSIVNQVRYNHHAQALASSGVEKCVKLWSQFRMKGCLGSITEQEHIPKRTLYSHDQYMQFIFDSGEPLNHDYDTQSTEEDPRMIAFFDSLIQRVNAGWFADESSDEETSINNVLMRMVNERIEEDDDEQVSVMDLRRLFRSNRRLLMDGLQDEEPNGYDSSSSSSSNGSDSEHSNFSITGPPILDSFFGSHEYDDSSSDGPPFDIYLPRSSSISGGDLDHCHRKKTTSSQPDRHLPDIVTTQFPESSTFDSHSIPGNNVSVPGITEDGQILPGSSEDGVGHIADKFEHDSGGTAHCVSTNFKKRNLDSNHSVSSLSELDKGESYRPTGEKRTEFENKIVEKESNGVCLCSYQDRNSNIIDNNKNVNSNNLAVVGNSVESTEFAYDEKGKTSPLEIASKTTGKERMKITEADSNNSKNSFTRIGHSCAISVDDKDTTSWDYLQSYSVTETNEASANNANNDTIMITSESDCDTNDRLNRKTKETEEHRQQFKKCKGHRERPYRRNRRK